MPTCCEPKPLTVALIGNPNTGKSTLFSALAGIHQRVGNYPGVTVEKKTGLVEHLGRRFTLVDLPGLYSLSPRSPDEMVALDVLLGRQADAPPVDAILCIADASNLPRSLYLLSQVLGLGLPTVLALNMLDVAENHGIRVRPAALQRYLGIPVVPVRANRAVGLAELKDTLARTVAAPGPPSAGLFPQAFDEEVDCLHTALKRAGCPLAGLACAPRWLVERLLLDASGPLCDALLPQADAPAALLLGESRARLRQQGCDLGELEISTRHAWGRGALATAVVHPPRFQVTTSDRLDRILTHRVWGSLVFMVLVVAIFHSVFVGAEPLMNAIDALMGSLGGLIQSWLSPGALRSLLVDGVLAGVGGVLTFLPQILILFLFLGILEDCGYMARAAYLMDHLMVRVGLSGKSFIPLLSSFACAVPGIMATRVIENPRDRLTTILVAPLMTCSARLPIYTLLIAAFIPRRTYLGGLLNLQGLTLVALYALGILAAVAVARLLKRTLLRGDPPLFLLELPSYKWPSLRTLLFRVVERAYLFVRFAGTMILAVSILVWAALYYPHGPEVEAPFQGQRQQFETRLAGLEADSPEHRQAAAELAALEHEIHGVYQRQSWLGRFGKAIEPVFRPLGWDWRIGSAVIASFPAREIVVATLGVIFNVAEQSDAASPEGESEWLAKLRAATWDNTAKPLFTLPVALSIMVFYALCAQCAATLAVMRRETNSWRWPAFAFTYMTGLAYIAAWATYQVSTWCTSSL